MAVSIQQLLTPLDKEDVLEAIEILWNAIVPDILALQPTEPAPAMLDAVVGWAVDDVWNPFVLPALQAQFGDYATGDWLTLLAQNTWRRPRLEAQAGTMTVVLENRGSFFGTINVGDIRVKSSVSGQTYTNTTSGSLVAWPGGIAAFPTVSLTFEADTAGTVSNAQPGDIAQYPTPLVAGPVGIYVQSNTVCLGSDDESDPNLLVRGRAAVGELSSNPNRQALLSVALDPTGALTRRNLPLPWASTYQPAITRARPVNTGAASVTVYLASSSGPAAGTVSTVNSDVWAANLAIQLVYGGAGVTITVQAANAHAINLGTVILTVSASSNVTATEAQTTAQAALDAFFATLPIGGARTTAGGTGYVFAQKIAGVLGAPAYVDEVSMSFADTALSAGDVAVPTYTIQVNVVDQS